MRQPDLLPRTNGDALLTVNASTLLSVHPVDIKHILPDDRWKMDGIARWWGFDLIGISTDVVAVCRKGKHLRTATEWWFWRYLGSQWIQAEWEGLTINQQLLVVADFCRYFRRDKSWVPWKDDIEETAMVWVALEQA